MYVLLYVCTGGTVANALLIRLLTYATVQIRIVVVEALTIQAYFVSWLYGTVQNTFIDKHIHYFDLKIATSLQFNDIIVFNY